MGLTNPIDAIQCFHRAFRRDMIEIDDYTLKAARNGREFTPILKRFNLFGDILDLHARGEEEAVFPAFDKITPTIAKTYFMDHRELDTMVSGLKDTFASPDALTSARATAVLNSHLRIHLNKEDAFLYPVLRERLSDDEQKSIIGIMSSKIPSAKMPDLIGWLFPLMGIDDRVMLVGYWMTLMPPQVFSGIKPLIKESLAEDWVELVKRVPDLTKDG